MTLRLSETASKPILIVGAGPVGLYAAIRLVLSGVDVVIVDKRTRRDGLSKALTVNPATIEALAMIGVDILAAEHCRRLSTISLIFNGALLANLETGALNRRFTDFSILPQYRTEEILEEKLAALGVLVRRGTTLVNLDVSECKATFEHPDCSKTTEQFAFVVGADGFHSSVRSLAGISNNVQCTGLDFAMVDAPIGWEQNRDNLSYVVRDQGFMVVIPLSGEQHRVVVSLRGNVSDVSSWDRAGFQAAVDVVDPGLRIGYPSWKSGASIRTQLAETFVSANCCLIGDAAHAFSPIGGLGMTTGIADAAHLSNALTSWLATGARAPLIEFNETRLEIARRIMALTNGLTEVISRRDRSSELYRMFAEADFRRSALQSFLVPALTGFAFKTCM